MPTVSANCCSLLTVSGMAKLTAGIPEKQIPALLALRREKDIVAAREDFDLFCEIVCKHDETGEPIRQARIHRAWTKAWQKYSRVLIWSHRFAGKTVQLSVLRTVWLLGRDPTLRFLILSSTQGRAAKIVAAIANYIANDTTVKEIFPKLAPAKGGIWSAMALDVEGRRDFKNSSVLACGVHTALRGARCDELVIDDILLPENVATQEQRRKVSEWVRGEAFGCLSKRHRIVVVGNAMHPDDILHELGKQKGWAWFRFPIIAKDGKSTWPEEWPMERVEEQRILMGLEFAKNMMCKARSDEDSRFKEEWINAALKRGAHLKLVDSLEVVPEGCSVWTGIDLAVSKKKKSGKTAIFTFLEDEYGHRTLLNLQAGKWTGPVIVGKIREIHLMFRSMIAVEDNACQSFILQFAQEATNIPVMPHTTTRMKRDPILGVEGLAIELANNKWTIPSNGGATDPEVAEWITEMLYYVPGAHTGDRLMACYFARELARRILGGQRGSSEVAVTIVGKDEDDAAFVLDEGPTTLEKIFDVPEPKTFGLQTVIDAAVTRIRAKMSALNDNAARVEPEETEEQDEPEQAVN